MERGESSVWKRLVLTILQPKIGIPLAIGLMAITAPFIYREYQVTEIPDIGDPFDVAAFCVVDVPDELNASIKYDEAESLLVEWDDSGYDEYLDAIAARDDAIKKGWSVAPPDLRQWVIDNQPALQVWREGTDRAVVYRKPIKDTSSWAWLPPIQASENLTYLAQLQGSRHADQGNVSEAWEWYRAGFRFSRHVGMYGKPISRILGVFIHSIMTDAINEWSVRSDVDDSLLRTGIAHLITDFEMTPVASIALKTDYVGIMYLLENQSLFKEYVGTAEDFPLPIPNSSRYEYPFIKNEPERSRRVAQHALANLLAEIDEPRYRRSPRASSGFFRRPITDDTKRLTADQIEKFQAGCAVTLGFLSFIDSVDREQAKQAGLVMTLAAQLYFREYGEFPNSAEQLVNDVLTEIPFDPWGKEGERMHYRCEGKNAVVWSVGENGIDDGGYVEYKDGDWSKSDIGYIIRQPKSRLTE